MSISYEQESSEVRPEIGWCVVRRKETSRALKKSSSFKFAKSREYVEKDVQMEEIEEIKEKENN